jgi:peroxiredoxin
MKNLSFLISLFVLITFKTFAEEGVETLKIGAKAPDFSLKGVDGKMNSLNTFSKADILVIIFTCNHCPTAQAYEDRIIDFQNKYKAKNVQVVAISPNADKAVRFDELGYSDLNDSYEEMKIRAKNKAYNFPYLYDGETQEVAHKYGPTTTPHAFVFDKSRILRYVGRIDDNEHLGKAKTFDLENAVNEMIAGMPVSVATTKTFGCSLKWKSKIEWKVKEVESWKSEAVSLDKINIDGIKDLMKGDGVNYTLINFWATWCGPCVAEFSSLTESDKMYRNREFKFVSVSLDAPKSYNKALAFLKKKYASNLNYIFGDESKYELMEAVDAAWQGALPHTVLLSPDGKIVYRQNGMINPLEIRKAIVDHIGRVYP